MKTVALKMTIIPVIMTGCSGNDYFYRNDIPVMT